METKRRPAPLEAFEAGLECAKAVAETFGAAAEVSMQTCGNRLPTEAMVRRMAGCMTQLEKAIEEGNRCIAPWRVDLAGIGGAVTTCGVTASSSHVLALKVAERFAKLNWSRSRVTAYFARFKVKTGKPDWDRQKEIPQKDRVAFEGLNNYGPFQFDEIEADLEREYAVLRRHGSEPVARRAVAYTQLEKAILKLLRTSGKAAMKGDVLLCRWASSRTSACVPRCPCPV